MLKLNLAVLSSLLFLRLPSLLVPLILIYFGLYTGIASVKTILSISILIWLGLIISDYWRDSKGLAKEFEVYKTKNNKKKP